jgi:hypothetical protein
MALQNSDYNVSEEENDIKEIKEPSEDSKDGEVEDIKS